MWTGRSTPSWPPSPSHTVEGNRPGSTHLLPAPKLYERHAHILSKLTLQIFKDLGNCLIQSKPVHALASLEVSAALLYRHEAYPELKKLTKELAILASSSGDCDKAVRHSHAVLNDRVLADLSEMTFVTDLLMKQYCDRGSFELAVQEARKTIEYIGSLQSAKTSPTDQLQCHMAR